MAAELIGFDAPDGLRLAARDWPGPAPDAPVLLCLHGLTRNGRDFEPLAEGLGSRWRALLHPGLRRRIWG